MDKNIIKQHLTDRFLTEAKGDASTPGIAVTKAVTSKAGAQNKKGVKDMEKELSDYDKDIKKTINQGLKYNYNPGEKEYHDQMEIMNGQEMIRYDRMDQKFQDRAIEAIEGSSRMGNEGGIGNAQATWGASSDDFGKNLVKNIKASTKKRRDAEDKFTGLGDDVEIDPSKAKTVNHRPDKDHSAYGKIKESDYGIRPLRIFENSDPSEKEKDEYEFNEKEKKEDPEPKNLEEEDTHNNDDGMKLSAKAHDKDEKARVHATNEKKKENLYKFDKDLQTENNNNKKPQIKESMKRLNFKKEFNGVGNALKMIPESYKVNDKTFEMTDGNESYKIRWEGTLNEGRAVILMASNKTMLNEDILRMKKLMGYKAEDTLGLVKGKARLTENTIFGEFLDKTRVIIEGEDIESQKSPEGEWEEEKLTHASEAKKDVEGSVATDKKVAPNAKSPKTGEWEEEDPNSSEASADVEGSVKTDKKVAPNLTEPKKGYWEEIKPGKGSAASEATAHLKEGVQIGNSMFRLLSENFAELEEQLEEEELEEEELEEDVLEETDEMEEVKESVKKKNSKITENVVGYGNQNVLNKLPPEERQEKLKTQPVYSEEEDGGGVSDDLVRKFFIKRFDRSPDADKDYFQTWVKRLNSPDKDAFMDFKSAQVWAALNGPSMNSLSLSEDEGYENYLSNREKDKEVDAMLPDEMDIINKRNNDKTKS